MTQTLLKLPEVLKKTCRGRTAIYTDPTFPKPIKVSTRSVAWIESEVDAWIAKRIAMGRGEGITEGGEGGRV